MPSPKPALSRQDELKRELAHALGVSVVEILTRDQVILKWGDRLKCRNAKSLSNRPANKPPFYRAPLFGLERAAKGYGLALYVREDLMRWVNDKDARLQMIKLGKSERPRPWPVTNESNATPPTSAISSAEAFLDNLTDDRGYKEMVLGLLP